MFVYFINISKGWERVKPTFWFPGSSFISLAYSGQWLRIKKTFPRQLIHRRHHHRRPPVRPWHLHQRRDLRSFSDGRSFSRCLAACQEHLQWLHCRQQVEFYLSLCWNWSLVRTTVPEMQEMQEMLRSPITMEYQSFQIQIESQQISQHVPWNLNGNKEVMSFFFFWTHSGPGASKTCFTLGLECLWYTGSQWLGSS